VQPQIIVRPAVPADYEAIARITRDSYLAAGYFDSPDHPYMRQIQDVARRAAQATIWVAERDGQVVGSVTLAVAGEPYADIALDDELEFRMLVVDPAVQRSGAGLAMVEAIIEHARALDGIRAVALTTGRTWESAHGLYRKTGFRRVPERDWFVPDTDIKLLVFRLDVQPT
jgi:N-acetylglutamate synthase-like GNAT family acetyltransferase